MAEATRASVTAYGSAGPAFVRSLIAEKISGADIRASVDDFIERVGVSRAHGQVRRVAMKAGLSAVAGELAILFGIVPWAKRFPVVAAAEYVFQPWLEHRGTCESHDGGGARVLFRVPFEQYGDSRFDPLRAVTPADPADGPFDALRVVTAPGELDLVRFDSGRSPTLKRLADGWRWRGKALAPQTWRDEICKGFALSRRSSPNSTTGGYRAASEEAKAREAEADGIRDGTREHEARTDATLPSAGPEGRPMSDEADPVIDRVAELWAAQGDADRY